MKRIIFAVVLSTVLFSCGKKEKEVVEEEYKIEETVLEESKISRGEELIAASDCLACHKVDEKVVGPSYKDVAAKYSDKDVILLVDKVINGGQGVWGEIPMTPHPAVSKEDATEMVNYILTLK
jgi:cytochrome c